MDQATVDALSGVVYESDFAKLVKRVKKLEQRLKNSKLSDIELQLQAGNSFKQKTISLSGNGVTIYLKISKKSLAELQKYFDIPEEG